MMSKMWTQLYSVKLCGYGNIFHVRTREPDKPSEELYTLLCQSQCSALWAVCSSCRTQGFVVKKLYEAESKIFVLEEQLHCSELLIQEKEMISKPLIALTREDKQPGQPVQFEWNEQCKEASRL